MDATTIIKDGMTLQEKLEAIDKAVAEAQSQADDQVQGSSNSDASAAPIDPADALMCVGCQ